MPRRTPDEQVRWLDGQLAVERPKLERFDRYIEGEQPLKYMAAALKEELGERVAELVLNWSRLGTEAYEGRLDLEGFRLPGVGKADEELWRIWQENDLDELSSQAHYEALGLGRSYGIVGNNPDDLKTPLITVESPMQVITESDPRTRRVTSGLKRWRDEDDFERAQLYGQNVDISYALRGGEWWQVDKPYEHNRGLCAVVPLVNRGRMMRPMGTSEFADIVGVADAANKMATDMMISGEFWASPRRAWFGMSEDEFQDENGNPIPVWSRLAGREWSTEKRLGTEVDVKQFTEADLAVFHNTIKLLAQLCSQLLSLPPYYMQFVGENPTSADAIRAGEAQLVKKCERKQKVFGGGWETIMRIAAKIAGLSNGKESDFKRLESIWRNAATPTDAQNADAAIKLYTAPPGQPPILPLRMVRQRLGYGPTEIGLMEAEDEKARRRDPLNEFFAPSPDGTPSESEATEQVTGDVAAVVGR